MSSSYRFIIIVCLHELELQMLSHILRLWRRFVGVPLEKALGFLPTKSLASMPLAGAAFVPPTSVHGIAKAAVAAATDPAVPGGIMDVWQLQQYDKQ